MIKGLCMYESLKSVCSNFHLYIFAFDDRSYHTLKELELEHITVISLLEFEDEKLLKAKGTRNRGEYCWTCTSSTILYCIQRFELSHCTYIDADLFFYNDPKILIDEMGNNDVLITEHRYTPKYDQSVIAGKYCVQFMTFKNTPNGLKILKWWINACLDWCYARYEDGKFGDQKYLDGWTTRFTGIHVLKHLGGGVAPWNMQQYSFRTENSNIKGTELSSKNEFSLIFFHFHHVYLYRLGFLNINYLGLYKIPSSVKRLIYLPYLLQLQNQLSNFKGKNIDINLLISKKKSIAKIIKSIARFILKNDTNYIFGL
jgi:hypothetical protein